MIWLDLDTPRPALQLMAHDLRLARSWPVHGDAVTWSDYGPGPAGAMFRTRRVVVAFESGWAASILWGTGSYSTNYDAWLEADPFTDRPDAVEVGIIHDGRLVVDPYPYLDAVDLAELLDLLAAAGGVDTAVELGRLAFERVAELKRVADAMRAGLAAV